MILQFAPGDAQAAAERFAARLAGDEFRAALDRLSRDDWQWGTPRVVHVHILKAHRYRCAFEVTVETERGPHALIAKAYSRDRADLHRAMEIFAQAGLGPEAEFSIPRPLANMPALALRLEEKVSGPSAQEIFLRGAAPERIAAARRCGRWLAHFQAAAPAGLGKVIDLDHERGRWKTWTDEVASFGEPLAGKARRLLDRLEAAAPVFSYPDRCAAHGSYIPDHVLLGLRRTTAIDLDQYGVADPAREVGWFIISIQRLALKHWDALHRLDDAVEAFVTAYRAGGRGDAVARAGFYRAVECLHRGRRDVVARTPPARAWAERMLDEALGVLA